MAEDIVGRLVYLITGDNSALDKALAQSSRKMQDAGKAMQRMGKRLTMGLTLPLAAAGIAALKFAADIETQQVAFATLLGDVEKGTKLFEDLKKFSAETPLQLKDITQGAQKLLAFGTAAEDVQNRLRTLGDLAMGNAQKLGSMVTAFGKIQVRGKATMEELNMVIDAGVPIIAALADGFGVTQAKLFEMVSAGEVKFPDFQAALESMTGAGGQFEGMMANIAETTSGKFSTAVDNVKLAAADLVQSLLPVVNDVLAAVTRGAQAFAALDEGTKRTILTIAGIALAAGPAIMIVGRLVSVIGVLRNAFIVARAATIAFNLALGVNPIFLVVMAITTLVAGIVILTNALAKNTTSAKENAEAWKEIIRQRKEAEEAGKSEQQKEIEGIQLRIRVREGLLRQQQEIIDKEAESVKHMGERAKVWMSISSRVKGAQGKIQQYEDQIAKLNLELQKLGETVNITTNELEILVSEKIREGFDEITRRAAIYGDEIDVVAEKQKVLRDAIDELISSGAGATNELVMQLKAQFDELEAGATGTIISESELRRRRWEEDLDFQIGLEEDRLTRQEEQAEYEKRILGEVDEYKRQLREQEAEEERQLNELKLGFTSDMATATGDVVSGMFERMSQAAGKNEKAQKTIARAQAIAGKAFALFQAVISTKAAIVNALATPPFSPLRVAFATAVGLMQIAAIVAKPIPKFAKGVNFVVPPGFEDDTFPMMVGTGEHVKVDSKEEVTAGGAGDLFHITVNFAGRMFYDEITKATRNRQIIIDVGALHES